MERVTAQQNESATSELNITDFISLAFPLHFLIPTHPS